MQYDFYLNCADMNGNPYDFQSYFSQEKVFDISDLGTIKRIQLRFYQQAGSFITDSGVAVPYLDSFDNLTLPNLFMNNVYVSLGYDVSQFDTEMIQIYTLDRTSYIRENKDYDNAKQIQLRWIHKQEDGTFKSITLDDDLDYEIRWYRYELGHASSDKYSDIYWKYLSIQEKDKNGNWTYPIKDESWTEYNEKFPTYAHSPGFFSSWLIPDAGRATEKVKAILLYKNEVIRSNVLTCYNDKEVNNIEVLDSLYGLTIHCDDETYGNYRIYKLGGGLLDSAQAYLPRTWTPMFKSVEEDVEADASEAYEGESITWIIPKVNTMIRIDSADLAAGLEEVDEEGNKIYDDNSNENYYIITRYGLNDSSENRRNSQTYYIKSYYNQNYNNNTIQCKLVKNGVTYIASKELTFGPSGSSGTDCTFILDFDNGVTAMTAGSEDAVTVTARLYDYENKEVDISGYSIKWDWKTDATLFDIGELASGESYRREIKWSNNSAITNANYSILQATLTGWGGYVEGSTLDLTAYLPIPIRSNVDYTCISGSTQVVYESSGNLTDYFKNPYKLWKAGIEEEGLKWSITNGVVGETVYTPSIKQVTDKDTGKIEYYLSPLSFYVENACQKICVVATSGNNILWSQPILIMQNRYPSSMLNKWDGELKIGDDSIMSPLLVAGKKNDNNTFSGVALGYWKSDSETGLGSQTGLYGYSEGKQSFAFTEDGNAFIGKSSGGRIIFKGDKATIESASYGVGKGMSLDLQAGTINAYQFTLKAGKKDTTYSGDVGLNNTIYFSTEADTYPLQIGSNFKVNWNGNVTANSGTFTGTINADSGYFKGDITGATGTFSGSLNVGNSKFVVDSSGNVTMAGNINLSNGSITWGNNETWYTKEEVDEAIAGIDVDLPSYIKSTYIDKAKVVTPTIYGGVYYATGQARTRKNSEMPPAYYLYNGITGSGSSTSVSDNNLIGYLSYDELDTEDGTQATERVLLVSNDCALKIQACGNNMSIGATTKGESQESYWSTKSYYNTIFFQANSYFSGSLRGTYMSNGCGLWCTSLPSRGEQGQIAFLIQ